MATTPNEHVEEREGLIGRAVSAAKRAVATQRARDSFIPSFGITALVLGATWNLALAIGAGCISFAFLDKHR